MTMQETIDAYMRDLNWRMAHMAQSESTIDRMARELKAERDAKANERRAAFRVVAGGLMALLLVTGQWKYNAPRAPWTECEQEFTRHPSPAWGYCGKGSL